MTIICDTIKILYPFEVATRNVSGLCLYVIPKPHIPVDQDCPRQKLYSSHSFQMEDYYKSGISGYLSILAYKIKFVISGTIFKFKYIDKKSDYFAIYHTQNWTLGDVNLFPLYFLNCRSQVIYFLLNVRCHHSPDTI